jgi:hypothetical protein
MRLREGVLEGPVVYVLVVRPCGLSKPENERSFATLSDAATTLHSTSLSRYLSQ